MAKVAQPALVVYGIRVIPRRQNVPDKRLPVTVRLDQFPVVRVAVLLGTVTSHTLHGIHKLTRDKGRNGLSLIVFHALVVHRLPPS